MTLQVSAGLEARACSLAVNLYTSPGVVAPRGGCGVNGDWAPLTEREPICDMSQDLVCHLPSPRSIGGPILLWPRGTVRTSSLCPHLCDDSVLTFSSTWQPL